MPRSSPAYWIARFSIGVALIVLAGLGALRRLLPGADLLGLGTFLPGFAGFFLALSSVTPLVRLATLENRKRRAWADAASEAFARASMPRRIYYLLAAVAEADGPMTANERETVRRFLLERFLDPVDADAIRTWETHTPAIADRMGLAALVATGLDDSERDSLFCWCCLVAFADGSYREHERAALQEVARGLGIVPARARMLFHLARAQFLRGQKAGDGTRPATAIEARTRALAVLGLPTDASAESIRKRHRQLVKQFHPDAQSKLGPVAEREATERFQEIQRAYEILST